MGGARTEASTEVKILLLSNRDWTASKIAEECGVSERTVNRTRRRYRSKQRTGRRAKWTQEDLDFAEELLKDGASYRDTAETTGISKDTLRNRFPGMGFSSEDTARVGPPLARTPEKLRWSLTRNRKD